MWGLDGEGRKGVRRRGSKEKKAVVERCEKEKRKAQETSSILFSLTASTANLAAWLMVASLAAPSTAL